MMGGGQPLFPAMQPAASAAPAAASAQAQQQQAPFLAPYQMQSQFLAQALQNIRENGGKDLRSPAALGSNMLAEAILAHAQKQGVMRLGAAERQMAQRLFPNDSRAQDAFMVNPTAMTEAISSQYHPQEVREGNTETVNGQPVFTAPKTTIVGQQAYTQTPTGITATGPVAPSMSDLTAAAAQAETARHNPVQEGIDTRRIAVDQLQAKAALAQAAAAAQNANTTQANSPNAVLPPGYTLRGSPQ